MRQAHPVEAVGVVRNVVGFGRDRPDVSISLSPWKWSEGIVERGELYIRWLDVSEDQLEEIREMLPEYSIVRVRVRPDDRPSEGGELCEALFDAVLEARADDPELASLAAAAELESRRARRSGRPRFDPSWLLFELLARLVAPPRLPLVALGAPLPPGLAWRPLERDHGFRRCEQHVNESEDGEITVGVRDGRVEGVFYDLATYRGSGPMRMRKLMHMQAHHSDEGKLHRFHDNRAGAMLYTNDTGSRYGVYFYLVDRFMVHTKRTRFRLKP